MLIYGKTTSPTQVSGSSEAERSPRSDSQNWLMENMLNLNCPNYLQSAGNHSSRMSQGTAKVSCSENVLCKYDGEISECEMSHAFNPTQ